MISYIINREITRLGCLSLYPGKWKKIKKVNGSNLFETVTLSYLIKKATRNKLIIWIDVMTFNVFGILSIVYMFSVLLSQNEWFFCIIWICLLLIHTVVRCISHIFAKTN